MGIGTLRGYNLYQPPDCNPQTRNHKQVSIFVELADAFRLSQPHDTRPERRLLLLEYSTRVLLEYMHSISLVQTGTEFRELCGRSVQGKL